ncbi:MAG: preprotein translocase subunit SecA [Candidatus Paceibacterota bacterium]
MSLIQALFGDATSKFLKEAEPVVKKINDLEPIISALSDADLKGKTEEFKARLAEGESLEDILPEAFAVVREASKRSVNMRHFDVQLIGGLALHRGKISEMRTGEGKTLVATLPVYLNALTGKGVHLVTVNDYLSRRDAVWMGQIYSFLGLSTGVINGDASYLYDETHIPQREEKELDEKRDEIASYKVVYDFLRPVTRVESYAADITYGTNNEFGFDYLRDNISYKKTDLRQREFAYAIVDEIDSILIDEARTPLIISGPAAQAENLYLVFAKIAESLHEKEDFEIDHKLKTISLNDSGIEKAEKILGVDNIYTEKGIKYVHHLETAVRAKALFHKDKEYVVRNGEIMIVDEFTGRMQPGRRWSEGLHQAIEAKEGVAIMDETRTYASVTFQNYFRLYKKLAGMTGTAKTSSEEFMKVYYLDTIVVPTHVDVKRIDQPDLIFQSEEGKFSAIIKKIKELNDRGQPVLIGTVSIDRNELLSDKLRRSGIPHEILNAKNHEKEGEIIAAAGKKGAVTIATNMAGRGVDIKLGGIPFDEEKYEEVKNVGGLFVLGTERHEARRIDNQLRGRSGRQGDPGETQFFVSLEDSLMKSFPTDTIKSVMKKGFAPDEAIRSRMVSHSIETAQTKIEGMHFDSRKHVLEFDNVLNHQRGVIYAKRRKILTGSDEEVKEVIEAEFLGDEEISKILETKENEIGKEAFIAGVRAIFLQSIDFFWMDHLEMMDYLRGSVNLRAYGQRDPLVEYKKEGLRLFQEMEISISNMIKEAIPNISGPITLEKIANTVEIHEETLGGGEEKKPIPAQKNSSQEVGRNDPCPCGSGKKYKKCHGAE